MTYLQTASAHGQQPLLLDKASEQGPRSSLSESEMYRRVFRVQEATRPEGLDGVTSSSSISVSSTPPKQLAPVSPGPAAIVAEGELESSSLKKALPYIPPHADYTIIKGKYEAAYHVATLEKEQSPRQGKSNKKEASDSATVQQASHVGTTRSPASRSNGSKVLAVAEWTFPKDDQGKEANVDKWAFIKSEVAKGRDVDFRPTPAGASYQVPMPARQGRKRKSRGPILLDEQGDPIWNSLVQDVMFDSRYLQYDNSPYGFLDQLVQPSVVVADPTSENSDVLDEEFFQTIPDPPINLTKTSRVGAYFQARVCRHMGDYHDKRNADYLPEYETLWDPVRANEAEKKGQDIDTFLLSHNMPLSEREMKMKLLHLCGYDVAQAQEEYNRIQSFGWEEDNTWTDNEKLKFKDILQSASRKDFAAFAKQMKRSRADCMVQYYQWKRKSRSYAEAKKRWKHWRQDATKNDYCSVCDDGGDLLVLCDRCDDAYHLSCLKPALSAIPTGDWFCPKCVAKKVSQQGGYITLAPRSSPSSKLWASPGRVAALGREMKREGQDKSQAPPRTLFPSVSGSVGQEGGVASVPGNSPGAAESSGSHLGHSMIHSSPGREESSARISVDSPFILSDDESEAADV